MFFYIFKLEKGSDYDPKSHFINFSGNISNFKFEISNLNSENLIQENIDSGIEDYKFINQKIVTGILTIIKTVRLNEVEIPKTSEIPFILRLGSEFAFIKTSKEIERIEACYCLNEWLNIFKIDFKEFIPRRDKVINFVCGGTLNEAKISSEIGIVDIEEIQELTNDTKKNILMKYPLIEADLEFGINNEIISLFYYGDALQFPRDAPLEQIEIAIQIFECVMFETSNNNKENGNNGHIPQTS